MTATARRFATIAALALLLAASFAAPARAEILAGCVAPEDAGVTHLVGWVDGGVMLGMADPEPPASLRVIAPDGTVTDYLNGEGLIAPTDSLPIWFARAEQTGDYQLIIDGTALLLPYPALPQISASPPSVSASRAASMRGRAD